MSIVQSLRALWDRVDERAIEFMAAHGILLLRLSLGIVFLWFGLLKVIGNSPVADLVANTIFWAPRELAVPFLGIWEMVIGLGFLSGLALRPILILFWLQMIGTFSLIVVRPDLAFHDWNTLRNPLLLTINGEFVIKNLILISAGLVIGSTLKREEKK